MIAVTVASEDATTRTLAWSPVAGAKGYRFTVDGKVSHTWNGSRTTVRVAKTATAVLVEALDVADSGSWPPPVQPPPPSGLKWPRPTLAPGFETHHVSNQNLGFGWSGQPLDYNKDHLFVFDEVVTAGTVYTYGGRNLVFVGGEVNLDGKEKPCGQFVNENVIGLQIQAHAGVCHLEGLWLHGKGMAQGLVVWAGNGKWQSTVRLQNCRLESLEKVAGNGAHSDAIQLYAGPNRLELYNVTLRSRGPCLQLQTYDLAAAGMPVPAGHHFERVNCEQLDQAGNCPDHRPPGGAYALWKGLKNAGGRAAWPAHNADCWIDCANATSLQYGYTAWADGFNGGSDDPHWGGWNPPGQSIWAGLITGEAWRFGSPPGGDYVPAGTVGMGYQP
jgi:hypothetical protein